MTSFWNFFDFYTKTHTYYGDRWKVEAWQWLVHVCRRRRTLVLIPPRRLNLRLFCTAQTPARDNLDVWPAFPLIVNGDMLLSLSSGTDNVIVALEQSNRVCQVILYGLRGWQFEQVLAAMQVPFPELTHLRLISDVSVINIPDSFWADLSHVCEDSNCGAFHFWDCQNCFCLLLTLSPFRSMIFLIPDTFHPKRPSLSSPSCPISNHLSFYSNPVNLALTAKLDALLHQNVLSSPLSTNFVSMGLLNI